MNMFKCLHHKVVFRSQNKITDFFMILAWVCPFMNEEKLKDSSGAPPQSSTTDPEDTIVEVLFKSVQIVVFF